MSSTRRSLEPGGLWSRLRAVTAAALESGALVPLCTERELLSEGGLDFQVRVAANLRRKDDQRRQALESAFEPGSRGARPNPFLPYDPALYVGDLTRTHVGLLNKFNVLDHHLLVVTRDFAPQEELLTRPDFEALVRCLQELDGLAFYNGGEEAGASQPHKHLQLVPLPLGSTDAPIPMEPAWEQAPQAPRGEDVVESPTLDHPHGLTRVEGVFAGEDPARLLHHRYHALLAHVGLAPRPGRSRQPGPYNLLVTRRWMLLVPRRDERFEGISFNGLAFAGSLFVRDRDQLEGLRRAGPLGALRGITGLARRDP